MQAMPEGLYYYNGAGEPCDMAYGPCCCGAWHKGEMLSRTPTFKTVNGELVPGDTE